MTKEVDWLKAKIGNFRNVLSLGQNLLQRPHLARPDGSLDHESVDLIVTSLPFTILRQKSYGNEDQGEYVNWLCEFGRAAFPTLKSTRSFVMDLGGSYEKGKPVRSLCNFRVLLEFCDSLGYRFAEDSYWFNLDVRNGTPPDFPLDCRRFSSTS
jgi:hypothetical protein